MSVNMSIRWRNVPRSFRVEVENGRYEGGTVMIGAGEHSDGSFEFNEAGEGKVLLRIGPAEGADIASSEVKITETPHPLSLKLGDVPRGRPLYLEDGQVEVWVEDDPWSAIRSAAEKAGSSPLIRPPAALPLYGGFTEEQIRQFGPARKPDILETERRVYTTPFIYENLDVGNFYEIDPTKGIEFKADDGFITITEQKPIVAVTVVGSGCVPKGYNIVEWWDEGESIDTMKNQLVKRQRIDNLNGTHPSIWSQLMFGTFPGMTYRDAAPGEIDDVVECLKKLSEYFYGGCYMGFYENTAYFRIGPPYPRRVTIRCGCKDVEDPGTSWERYPGDYAIRVVEVTLLKEG